jgi:hypothetical protein
MTATAARIGVSTGAVVSVAQERKKGLTTAKEFREVHSIYRSLLENELRHGFPLPDPVEELLDPQSSTDDSQPVARPAEEWLELLDMAVTPHMVRSYFKERDAQDSSLRTLIRVIVSKKSHSQEDRDKVDWLATHLFRLREEQKQRLTTWPKNDVVEILAGFEFPTLSGRAQELLMEMPSLLDEVKYLEHFNQITDSRIIQRARDLKNRFGDEFFHPDVLAAIVNYNLFFGKRFHALMQETMRQVREFAQSTEQLAPTASDLIETDYRLTGDALRQLSEIGRKEVVSIGGAESAPQEVSPEQQLKQLGIDVDQEVLYLRNRADELTMRLRANLSMSSIQNSFAPLLLSEWEASAFRTVYPEAEQSFRADFAHSICRAITLIYRIYEEIPSYLEKQGSEYLWKRHYDSLVYLLYEGRNQRDVLGQLSAASEKRGLPEKSRHLQSTAQKLDVALAKVAELF